MTMHHHTIAVTLGLDPFGAPVIWDARRNLVIVGNAGQGKTTLVRQVIEQLPQHADVIVLDPLERVGPLSRPVEAVHDHDAMTAALRALAASPCPGRESERFLVIDDGSTLRDRNPEAVEVLRDLVMLAGAFGVRTVLSTQRLDGYAPTAPEQWLDEAFPDRIVLGRARYDMPALVGMPTMPNRPLYGVARFEMEQPRHVRLVDRPARR